MPDIIDTLNSKHLNEFKKDFAELMRVAFGINREYAKMTKDIDKYIPKYEKIVKLFNIKYKNIVIKSKKTKEEFALQIFIKEKSVKDVFANAASRLSGLKAVGANNFNVAAVEEADRFSKELDKLQNELFISYHGQAGSSTISLEYNKKTKFVELNYDKKEIANERSPEFKLLAYYAVKDGIKKADIYEKLASFGFTSIPKWQDVNKFHSSFNPRIDDI